MTEPGVRVNRHGSISIGRGEAPLSSPFSASADAARSLPSIAESKEDLRFNLEEPRVSKPLVSATPHADDVEIAQRALAGMRRGVGDGVSAAQTPLPAIAESGGARTQTPGRSSTAAIGTGAFWEDDAAEATTAQTPYVSQYSAGGGTSAPLASFEYAPASGGAAAASTASVRANRHGSISVTMPSRSSGATAESITAPSHAPSYAPSSSSAAAAAAVVATPATRTPVPTMRFDASEVAARYTTASGASAKLTPSVHVSRRGSVSIDFNATYGNSSVGVAPATAAATAATSGPKPTLVEKDGFAAPPEQMQAHARIVQYALDLEQHVATTDATIAEANNRARVMEIELNSRSEALNRAETEGEELRAAARVAETRLFELGEEVAHRVHAGATQEKEVERVREDAAQLSAALVELESECARYSGELASEHNSAVAMEHALRLAARKDEDALVETEGALHSALAKLGQQLVVLETTGGAYIDDGAVGAASAPTAPGANGATRFSLPCRYRVVHTEPGAVVRREPSLYSDAMQTLPCDAVVNVAERRVVDDGVVRLGLENGGWVSEFETLTLEERDSSGATPPARIVSPILLDLIRNAVAMWEKGSALMRGKLQSMELAHAEELGRQRRDMVDRANADRERELASQRENLIKQAEAQLRRVVEDTRADAELEIQRVRTQLESEHVAAKDEALAEQREYLGRTSEMRIQDAVADATETQRNKMAMAHRVQLDGALGEQRSALSQQFVIRHTHETRLALQEQQHSFEQQARQQMQAALDRQRNEIQTAMTRGAADELAAKLLAQSELLQSRAEEDKAAALTRQREELLRQFDLDEAKKFEEEKAALLATHARDLEEVRRQHSDQWARAQQDNTRMMEQQRVELTQGIGALKQNLDSLSLSVTAPAVNSPSANPSQNILPRRIAPPTALEGRAAPYTYSQSQLSAAQQRSANEIARPSPPRRTASSLAPSSTQRRPMYGASSQQHQLRGTGGERRAGAGAYSSAPSPPSGGGTSYSMTATVPRSVSSLSGRGAYDYAAAANAGTAALQSSSASLQRRYGAAATGAPASSEFVFDAPTYEPSFASPAPKSSYGGVGTVSTGTPLPRRPIASADDDLDLPDQ